MPTDENEVRRYLDMAAEPEAEPQDEEERMRQEQRDRERDERTRADIDSKPVGVPAAFRDKRDGKPTAAPDVSQR